MGGVIFYKSKFLVSCARTCQDPVDHTGNSTVTTCADGTTEHTEDEGLGVNICCSSASALCQTGNNDGKSWNFPSYLYQREIQPDSNRSASNALTSRRSSKKTAGNKTKMKMEYWSTIPRVMMTFHLWNERLIFTLEEVPASEELFASTAELCSVNFSLSSLLWNNGIA